VNLNARINILYLIDGLLFTSSTALLTSYHQDYQHVHKKPRTLSPAKQSHHPTTSTIASSSSSSGPQTASFNYGYLIKKDIIRLVEIVVPTSFKKKGLLNFMSTAQVLKNWKAQVALIDQFLDAALLDRIHQLLNERKQMYFFFKKKDISGLMHWVFFLLSAADLSLLSRPSGLLLLAWANLKPTAIRTTSWPSPRKKSWTGSTTTENALSISSPLFSSAQKKQKTNPTRSWEERKSSS
jgi:hypothetical protein